MIEVTSLSVGRVPSPAVLWAQMEFSFCFFGGAPAMAMKPPSPKHWPARELFRAMGVSASLAEGRGRAPCYHGSDGKRGGSSPFPTECERG